MTEDHLYLFRHNIAAATQAQQKYMCFTPDSSAIIKQNPMIMKGTIVTLPRLDAVFLTTLICFPYDGSKNFWWHQQNLFLDTLTSFTSLMLRAYTQLVGVAWRCIKEWYPEDLRLDTLSVKKKCKCDRNRSKSVYRGQSNHSSSCHNNEKTF